MAGERDKLLKFLDDKKASSRCEVCATNKWIVPTEDNGLVVGIPIQQAADSYSIPGPVIPALIMICENCGNVRFHAARLVDPPAKVGG